MNAPENNPLAAPGRVLVVDDHAPARASICDILQRCGHETSSCSSAAEALAQLEDDSFDLVLTDLQMPGMNGLDFIRHLQQHRLGVQVVMITAHATVSSAVEAMRHGAFDYLEKPLKVDALENTVAKAITRGRLLDGRCPLGGAATHAPVMIGSSPAMEQLRARIAQVASTDETVLITGESGTGKELVAASIHACSRRADQPLVSLNCPALSQHLMESELFGHERGAFTGADSQRTGRFELADRGTILLDEVTEIELPLQAKLLRVLQEKAIERVGSSETFHVDVRVMATSNRQLQEAIDEGSFRQDLYYRLAVVPLQVPPLRTRTGDVVELCAHFLRRAALRMQRAPRVLTASAAELMENYHWPGNVRELENLMTRASVLGEQSTISADELRPWLIDSDRHSTRLETGEVPVGLSLQEMERKLIEATLQRFGGHRAHTAKALGIGVRTLSGKLRSYGYAPREKSFARAG